MDEEDSIRFQRVSLLALGAVVIIVAGAAAYGPAMKAGFIWDDNWLLYDNPCVLAPDGLQYFWFPRSPEHTPGKYNVPDYLPVTFTTFWVEWRLWGKDPNGYHVTNILLHVLGALLLWRVLAGLKLPGAWLAGLLFVVHPVNVTSVAWISERKNVLSMIFYLLTFLAWLKFDDTGSRRWYAASLAMFLLALLSKSSVVVLPVVLLGIVWWRRRRVAFRDLLWAAPFFALAATLSVVTVLFQRSVTVTEVPRPEGVLSRLAAAGWCVGFYLYKDLIPVNLAMVYPRWNVDPARLTAWIPLLLLVAALVLFWRFRRSWGRAPLAALVYFIVALLPVLGILDAYLMLYSLVFDHWQHLALLSVVAFTAGAGWWAAARSPFPVRVLAGGTAAAVVAVLSVLTWKQAETCQTPEALWEHNIRLNGESWLVRSEYGGVLFSRGDLAGAAREYAKSIELRPGNPLAYCNLGSVQYMLAEDLRAQGSVAPAARLEDQAFANLKKSLDLEPQYDLSNRNFAKLLARRGRLDEAVRHLQIASDLKPNNAQTRLELAEMLNAARRYEEAAAQLNEVFRLSPREPLAHHLLGLVLFQKGRIDEAAREFNQALELNADFQPALASLGALYAMVGRFDLADGPLARAVELAPRHFDAVKHLAQVRYRLGNAFSAVSLFYHALKLRPDSVEVMDSLARVLATCPVDSLRNGGEAVRLAEEACRRTGNANAAYLDTLAAAYAEVGRFEDAVRTAKAALGLAEGSGNKSLADQVRQGLDLYSAGKPLRPSLQTLPLLKDGTPGPSSP